MWKSNRLGYSLVEKFSSPRKSKVENWEYYTREHLQGDLIEAKGRNIWHYA